MSKAKTDPDSAGAVAATPKRSSKGLIAGAVLAVVLGAGGFYSVWSGLILAPQGADHAAEVTPALTPLGAIEFVPMEPIIISLAPGARVDHLRFQAQLEVAGPTRPEVELLMPRVVDVLNSYLRAVDPADLERPNALAGLRAQMLRRVQIVVGEGRVTDLLIMEFILT